MGALYKPLQNGEVTTAKIADANVTTAKIADANVTTAKIADASVTTAKIADANVTTAKIADANVTAAKIADANVTAAKIADGAVDAKIAAMAAGAVGTYAYLSHSAVNNVLTAGNTYAGSVLRYAGLSGDNTAATMRIAVAPAGTWRAMGTADATDQINSTVFMRIS